MMDDDAKGEKTKTQKRRRREEEAKRDRILSVAAAGQPASQ